MTYPMQAQEVSQQSPEFENVGSAYTYRLPRAGGRPLVFRGNELAMAMSFTSEIPYWYEINLYRSDQHVFVVAIRLFYQSENKLDNVKSWEFSSLEEALSFIEGYDAGQDIQLPAMDTDHPVAADLAAAALQTKAEVAAVRHHFSGLVGELFAEIDTASIE